MYNLELTEPELNAVLFALTQDLDVVLDNPEDWTVGEAEVLQSTIAKIEAIQSKW